MFKRVCSFVAGCGITYGGIQFFNLTNTLLADGQFFTSMQAAVISALLILVGGVLIILGID